MKSKTNRSLIVGKVYFQEKIRSKFFQSGFGKGLGEVNAIHDTFNGDDDLMDLADESEEKISTF